MSLGTTKPFSPPDQTNLIVLLPVSLSLFTVRLSEMEPAASKLQASCTWKKCMFGCWCVIVPHQKFLLITLAVACCDQSNYSCLSLAPYLTSLLPDGVDMVVSPTRLIRTTQHAPNATRSAAAGPRKKYKSSRRKSANRQRHKVEQVKHRELYWIYKHIGCYYTSHRNQSNIPRGTNKAVTNEVIVQMNCVNKTEAD